MQPNIICESVDDLYSFYRFYIGLEHDLVEMLPISSLKRLSLNKNAVEGWIYQDLE